MGRGGGGEGEGGQNRDEERGRGQGQGHERGALGGDIMGHWSSQGLTGA